ncbi:MAG: PEP-CTERM sorting domain-containing protein [Isosphaeraceae bacterium]|nr:PEP-CTERM sorting domain-containing protein [Isosphaeraceae bacterium]
MALVLGATSALANPLVVQRAAAPTAPDGLARVENGGAGAAPAVPALEGELIRALPLPEIVAPAVGSDSADPRIAYLPSGHSIRYDRAQPRESPIRIPEPASIVLLATGAVGLLARRALRRVEH